MTTNDKCMVCGKNIYNGDIFTKVDIDMHRLIYNEFEGENNFLVPNGLVHTTEKFYLCEDCSQNIMKLTPKYIAEAIVKSKDESIHRE